MGKYTVRLKRNSGIPKTELLSDLRRVTKKLQRSPTMDEYESHGKFKRGVFKKKFGSWNNALTEIGFAIRKRGNNTVTQEMLLRNLASVWEKLAKQPSQNNLDDKNLSEFGSSTYKKRFGTYNNSLRKFEAWINGNGLSIETQEPVNLATNFKRTKRNVNLRMRWNILKRDNFKCVKCGNSPAVDPSVILHVDHVKAWTKDGETIMENLETLCSKCNWGKSNL